MLITTCSVGVRTTDATAEVIEPARRGFLPKAHGTKTFDIIVVSFLGSDVSLLGDKEGR